MSCKIWIQAVLTLRWYSLKNFSKKLILKKSADNKKHSKLHGMQKVKEYKTDYSKTCVKQTLKNRQNKDLNDKW